MSKKPQRVKSTEESAAEAEFYRRRNLPGVNVRHMDAGTRFASVAIAYCGVDLGTRSPQLKRGVEVGVLYHLPSLDAYNAYRNSSIAKEAT